MPSAEVNLRGQAGRSPKDAQQGGIDVRLQQATNLLLSDKNLADMQSGRCHGRIIPCILQRLVYMVHMVHINVKHRDEVLLEFSNIPVNFKGICSKIRIGFFSILLCTGTIIIVYYTCVYMLYIIYIMVYYIIIFKRKFRPVTYH